MSYLVLILKSINMFICWSLWLQLGPLLRTQIYLSDCLHDIPSEVWFSPHTNMSPNNLFLSFSLYTCFKISYFANGIFVLTVPQLKSWIILDFFFSLQTNSKNYRLFLWMHSILGHLTLRHGVTEWDDWATDHTRTHTHTHMHTSTRTHTHAHTHRDTHARTHTQTHTCTHTHTHTHTFSLLQLLWVWVPWSL